MRKIDKQGPPADLTKYVTKEHPVKFEEIHHSKYFPQLYEDCRDRLIREQLCLSGYTEKPLACARVHIDHYRKQALFNAQNYVFGWDNLIADEHADYGADSKDTLVSQVADYDNLIDPTCEDPHYFFTYVDEGYIVPKNSLTPKEMTKATFTIKAFNLLHPYLIEKRRQAIKLVHEYMSYGLSCDVIMESLSSFGFPSVVEYALQDNG